MPSTATITDAELLALESQTGRVHELIAGEVREKPMARWLHSRVCYRLLVLLGPFAEERGLGEITEGQGQYHVSDEWAPAPDVALVSMARAAAADGTRGMFQGPPDLAIEVLSPHDSLLATEEKIAGYLEHGCRLCWIVDPQRLTVRVYTKPWRPDREARLHDTLTGGEVLPGLEINLADVFKDVKQPSAGS